MKTPGMGWGVRALCDIPHGTYISCYHGEYGSIDSFSEYGNIYYFTMVSTVDALLIFLGINSIEKRRRGP